MFIWTQVQGFYAKSCCIFGCSLLGVGIHIRWWFCILCYVCFIEFVFSFYWIVCHKLGCRFSLIWRVTEPTQTQWLEKGAYCTRILTKLESLWKNCSYLLWERFYTSLLFSRSRLLLNSRRTKWSTSSFDSDLPSKNHQKVQGQCALLRTLLSPSP